MYTKGGGGVEGLRGIKQHTPMFNDTFLQNVLLKMKDRAPLVWFLKISTRTIPARNLPKSVNPHLPGLATASANHLSLNHSSASGDQSSF